MNDYEVTLTLPISAATPAEACRVFLTIIQKREVDTLSFDVIQENGTKTEVLDIALP